MTFRAAALLLGAACACAALGCMGTPEDVEGTGRMDISRRIVANHRATYALACANDNAYRVEELEDQLSGQRRNLAILMEERRQLQLEAAQLRAYSRAPDEIRLVQAMNLEGEARRLDGDIANLREIISKLEQTASWHRRQAGAETRRISQILRHPAPMEGEETETVMGWTVERW